MASTLPHGVVLWPPGPRVYSPAMPTQKSRAPEGTRLLTRYRRQLTSESARRLTVDIAASRFTFRGVNRELQRSLGVVAEGHHVIAIPHHVVDAGLELVVTPATQAHLEALDLAEAVTDAVG